MSKLLEQLINEFNPRHDFDYFNFVRYQDSSPPQETISDIFHNLSFALYIPKHITRGAIIGGAAGAVVALISKTNIREGIFLGATAGGVLDIGQYLLRVLYNCIKTI